ncbi:MAG: hypothetical protein LBK67_06890 [Coriobacteriales bacterium]|jgi:hypothetical protein|nr:hypothetical protein [Coriobacteriales bacterium]
MNDRHNNAEVMMNIRYGAAHSRRLLIETARALSVFQNAITVIGAHAIHAWVQNAWGPIEMEATRDSDVSINPIFVTKDPKITNVLKGIGVEPAHQDRPGIYGLASESGLPWMSRTTIDLLVPEVYAGGGRRAARIPGQKNSASRAKGLELTIWDRHLLTLETVDDPKDAIEIYVAGPASLLIAKAHKVHERLERVASHPERLRPKDSGDIALLMMVSDPETVSSVMHLEVKKHAETAKVVRDATLWLAEMYGNSSDAPVTRQHAADSLAARFDEAQVFEAIDNWLERFSY